MRVCALLTLCVPALALAQPSTYSIEPAGLYGPEFTNTTGGRSVTATRLATSGVLAGRSERFVGGTASLGFAAWSHSQGLSTRIGFWDAAHTSATNQQTSAITAINASGTIIGSSTRYSPTGTTAWRSSEGASERLGLTDAEHTATGGVQASGVVAINTAGEVLGSSRLYPESGEAVLTAWLLRGQTYVPVGLSDAEHTSPHGYTNATPRYLSESSFAAGTSRRYVNGVSAGTSAWLWHDGAAWRVGFYDAVHTDALGSTNSFVRGLSPLGLTIGTSDRYVSGQIVTSSAWIASATDTTRIGLWGGDHTSTDNQELSEPAAISTSGKVIGRSFRYVGGFSNGESAWLYDGVATTRIGFTDALHTSGTDFQYSLARVVNDRGDVLGQSTMFLPNINGGASVWVYSDGQTRRVGLFDTRHTSPQTGFQNSVPIALNARGDAIGTSSRYSGAFVDDAGWYYDRATNTTHELTFSTNAIGNARTSPAVLLDSGVVLGSYRRYQGETVVGTFAFRWSLADGMVELGELVQGGLGPAGWQFVSSVNGTSTPGSWDESVIAGSGRLTGASASTVCILRRVPTCDPDVNQDGNVDQDDLAYLIAVLAGGPNPTGRDPDFNLDGNADQDDLAALIGVIAGADCP